MNTNMKINSDNTMFFGDKKKYVVYSVARSKWLEQAAEQLMEIEGDDTWVDWVTEGKRLTKEDE